MTKTARWVGGFGIAAAILLGTTAGAQEPGDTLQEVPQPFVVGGVYDKPYLTNLLGRTAIGGYTEMQARWLQVDGVRDELGFELLRWNIFAATQVSDYVRMAAEIEFEDLGDEVAIEFAAIDFIVHPAFALRAGAILSPLGRFNLAHDSPANAFTARPLVATEIIGTPLTEPGIGGLGVFELGWPGRITYELYAVNGFSDDLVNDSPDGTRIPRGKRNFEDNNNSPAAVGRLAWGPRLGYELGISGHTGAYNTFLLDGERIDERRNLSVWVIDWEATVADIDVTGEAATANIDIVPSLEGIFASRQRGVYVQAVRDFGRGWIPTIPTSYFQLGLRYDGIDFDADLTGDSVQLITAGFNFRPSDDSVVKLDYVRGRSRDRFNNPADEASIQFSVATYF